MIGLILRAATGTRVIAAVVVMLVGGFGIFQVSPYAQVGAAAGGIALPEEQPRGAAEFSEFLAALGPEGRADYRRFQFWDVATALFSGVAGCLLLAWLLKKNGAESGALRNVVMVPVAGAALDLLENAMMVLAIRAYPEEAAGTAALPWITNAKLAAFALMMLLVVALAVGGTVRRLRRRAG